MTKKLFLSATAAIALATFASPAFAQQGTVNGGIGIGAGLVGFNNTASSNLTNNTQSTLGVSINRDITGASGSGFAGTMNIASLPGGTSFAVVGGIGTSSTHIDGNVNLLGNGVINSSSSNAGIYGGLTGGNANMSMQVLNFGQSSADYKLAVNLNVANQQTFTETHLTQGFGQGVGAFAFGSLGWDL